MNGSPFDRIRARAQRTPRRIVLPESADERVLRAAVRAARDGLARPVLLGDPETIRADLQRLELDPTGLDLHDPGDAATLARFTARLVELGSKRGMTAERAAQAVTAPLTYGCLMVREQEADGLVAGAVTATAEVVRNALRTIARDPDAPLVSSCFLMLFEPGHPIGEAFVAADCALVIEPDAQQLAAIASAAGDSAERLLGLEPNVAMLSFSTAHSAKHANVTKVREATALARAARPGRRIVGEVQLDAAVVPGLLARKAPDEPAGPPCNVLVFPSLDAGNIGYKLIQRFGGARAVGPILQGLLQPVNDLSRGCSSDDIVDMIAVTAAQVRHDG